MRCSLRGEGNGSLTSILRYLIRIGLSIGIRYNIGCHHVRQYRICHAKVFEESPSSARTSLLHNNIKSWRFALVGKGDGLAIVRHRSLITQHGSILLAQLHYGMVIPREACRGVIQPVILV